MVKKAEEKREVKEDKIFKTLTDSYTAFSKMWEDSYLNLYKPWIEASGEMLEKTTLLSKKATPKKYQEFYDEWIKTYENSFGKLYPIPTLESNKEILEKFLRSAEESNKIYRSWIAQLEENTKKTKEILKGKQDAAKYKECYDVWVKSYEKIFDDLMELPAKDFTKEMFGNYVVSPDIYLGSFLQMSKLFKKSYEQLCKPLNESMSILSEKMAEISRGDADPEAYKEFYNLWVNTYKDIHARYKTAFEPSGEAFEHFVESTKIYLGMYKTWIEALEKMSEKAKEISIQTSDPEAFKEFNDLWLKMYEKAFDSFFDDMPTLEGPMKEVMEPVKIMAKMYADTFIKMSKMWVKSDSRSATAYPGKNKK